MAKKILTDEDKNAIWFVIENKFFTPQPKDCRGWLVAYNKFIKGILGIKENIDKPESNQIEIAQNSPIHFYFGEFTFLINLSKQVEKFAFSIIVDNEQYN